MAKEYDPRMHTAEHILNQTMVRMFGCDRSFSNHLERKKSKCDYLFVRDLTSEETQEIESRVNAVLSSDVPVTEEMMAKDLAATKFDLSRIPDQTTELVRIINVGDYDACPCIGHHVASTKEVGTFRIISTSFEDGTLRLRFKLAEGLPHSDV